MEVFDLDGTLRSIRGSGRLAPKGALKLKNRAWHKWQRFVNANGTLIASNAEIFKNSKSPVIVTSSQFGTQAWCDKHGLKPNAIIERAAKDETPPFEYKKKFIDSHQPQITLWVDDCPKVCEYAISKRIETILVN